MFTVATVSQEVNKNHLAWANDYDSFDTLEEAQKEANKLWKKMCDDAAEAGSNYVGETVIVHDGVEIY